MVIEPKIYTAKVMHRRIFPKENTFEYGVYYLAIPLPAPRLPGCLARFHAKDVGERNGTDPIHWVRNILANYNLSSKIQNIVLVAMPRVLGYVFNPVSFYLCLDDINHLRAVLCEVHNTFGEQHSYLCANPDHSPLTPDHWLVAEKVFHVSPFLERNGTYKFRFDLTMERLSIWIDYYDINEKKQLITSLIGTFSPLTMQNLRRAFWRHPLVALKTILLIHYQALRLFCKGMAYITKPLQSLKKITHTRGLEKSQTTAFKE